MPIGAKFLTDEEGIKLEITIGFSPFGKAVKLRKKGDGYYSDMPFKHLSIQETGYNNSRVAIYIKSASNLKLDFAEVTDEGDFALLPAEVVYRDIDTAILQSKAAEMVTDIADAVEGSIALATETANKLLELNENYKTNLSNVLARIDALEEN